MVLAITGAAIGLLTACGGTGIDRINHVVVIYLENHSFDNLYGSYSGAEGLKRGGDLAAPGGRQRHRLHHAPAGE